MTSVSDEGSTAQRRHKRIHVMRRVGRGSAVIAGYVALLLVTWLGQKVLFAGSDVAWIKRLDFWATYLAPTTLLGALIGRWWALWLPLSLVIAFFVVSLPGIVIPDLCDVDSCAALAFELIRIFGVPLVLAMAGGVFLGKLLRLVRRSGHRRQARS